MIYNWSTIWRGEFYEKINNKGQKEVEKADNEIIEAGKYYLMIDDNEVVMDALLLKQIDSFSKIFKYRRRFYALLIELGINENLGVCLDSSYMMKNKHYKRNFMLREAKGLKNKFKTLIKIIFPLFVINHFFFMQSTICIYYFFNKSWKLT